MNTKHKIILASASPRRKQILENLKLNFEIIPSDYEEFLDSDIFCYQKIEALALNKAKSVEQKIKASTKNSPKIIISADTVVVLDNKILGKPKDTQEAFDMLKNLSGKEHFVVTSICAIKNDDIKLLSTTSFVEFKPLSDKEIEEYINDFNPLDKAGSYGIQELPQGFVVKIKGSFDNIVGLCPKALNQIISEF